MSDTNRDSRLEELGFSRGSDGTLSIDDIVIAAPPIPACHQDSDIPKERLIITYLVVKDFKSYAGEQIIGPFNKHFTAIVGPNGSGKSNVIDALMFVFGSKSSNIRAKKLTALIHNSSQHQNVTSCTVTVHFATIIARTTEEGTSMGTQETEWETLQGSDFCISRTVTLNGQSKYMRNHKEISLKDLTVILKQHRIDLDYNRFLIMQGEVESISLMKPKKTDKEPIGFLEYIEDVIGSHRYIKPIQQFQEKANAIREHEKIKENDVKLCESEKKEAEGPKDQAVTHLRLQNKETLCKNSIFHVQRSRADKELADIVENKNKFKEEMEALKTELRTIIESKKSLEKDRSKLNVEHNTLLEAVKKYEEEFQNLCKEDQANIQNRSHIKGVIQKSKKEMEESQNEINKLKKQLAIFEKETAELQERKELMDKDKTVVDIKATEAIGNLKQETKVLQEQKDSLEENLVGLKDNVNQIKSEMDLIKNELRIYQSGEKNEKEKLSTLESDHKKNQDLAKKEENLIQEETNQIKEIEQEISSLKVELAESKEKEIQVSRKSSEARQRWDEARSSQQSTRSNSSLLNGLLQAKSQGKLPQGILGRLGDLGAIDAKYDVAISTACGRLDNIVTDTLETAKKCVEYMKTYNLGYTTFIALDQLGRFDNVIHQPFIAPENVSRLFDLVRVKNPAVLPAFYLALHNTLVARDISQAIRIGMGSSGARHRVVSLDGNLVETSGSVSGGGKAKASGKMGSTVAADSLSDEELSAMADQAKSLHEEARELQKLIQTLSDKISQKQRKMTSLQHSLKKRSLNYKAFKEQVQMLAAQLVEQQKKTKESTVDENKVAELEGKITAKNKIYQNSHEESLKVEKQVKALQTKILEMSKGKFSKAKKTAEELKKKLDAVTQALTKSTVNMKQSKTKVQKLETKIAKLKVDLEENETQYVLLKEKTDELTVKGQKAKELKEEHEKKLTGHAEKEKGIVSQIKKIEEKEHSIKKSEIELKNSLKECEAEEHAKNGSIRHYNAELTKLKLEKVENDPTDIPTLSAEEIEKLNLKALQAELNVLKVQVEDGPKGAVKAIQHFEEKNAIYKEKHSELLVIRKERIAHEHRRVELEKLRLQEFMAGFQVISKKVKEIYCMITAAGGSAELEVDDGRDPFEKGVLYTIRPPSKSWKQMSHLSGGEKTLSSLALVFALHYYRTTPFYIMDEIDAALDVKNVAIVGKFLMENQKDAQFILVSLRNQMNELPDQLLGIFKVDNCTKNLSIVDAGKWNKKNDDNTQSRVAEVEMVEIVEEEENRPSTSQQVTEKNDKNSKSRVAAEAEVVEIVELEEVTPSTSEQRNEEHVLNGPSASTQKNKEQELNGPSTSKQKKNQVPKKNANNLKNRIAEAEVVEIVELEENGPSTSTQKNKEQEINGPSPSRQKKKQEPKKNSNKSRVAEADVVEIVELEEDSEQRNNECSTSTQNKEQGSNGPSPSKQKKKQEPKKNTSNSKSRVAEQEVVEIVELEEDSPSSSEQRNEEHGLDGPSTSTQKNKELELNGPTTSKQKKNEQELNGISSPKQNGRATRKSRSSIPKRKDAEVLNESSINDENGEELNMSTRSMKRKRQSSKPTPRKSKK